MRVLGWGDEDGEPYWVNKITKLNVNNLLEVIFFFRNLAMRKFVGDRVGRGGALQDRQGFQ